MLKTISLVTFLYLITCAPVIGQSGVLPNTSMSSLSDVQVISELRSDNERVATRAAVETFKRGDRMLPLLFGLRGIKTLYNGYCLNDDKAFVPVYKPNEDTNREDANPNNGWYVTVEAASLYLISAIYYENISFAGAPYLTGKRAVTDRRYNTPERLNNAWNAANKWYKELQKVGLRSLRETKKSPLYSTDIKFLWTAPSRNRDLSTCMDWSKDT